MPPYSSFLYIEQQFSVAGAVKAEHQVSWWNSQPILGSSTFTFICVVKNNTLARVRTRTTYSRDDIAVAQQCAKLERFQFLFTHASQNAGKSGRRLVNFVIFGLTCARARASHTNTYSPRTHAGTFEPCSGRHVAWARVRAHSLIELPGHIRTPVHTQYNRSLHTRCDTHQNAAQHQHRRIAAAHRAQ